MVKKMSVGRTLRKSILVTAAMVFACASIGLMAAPFAYITNNNSGSNSVSVIDLATNIVTATIPITPALAQPYGVAVNGSGTRVYISNTGADTVSVINTATNAVIANIPVAGGPRGIAIDRKSVV